MRELESLIVEELNKHLLVEGVDKIGIAVIEIRAAITGYPGYAAGTPVSEITCELCHKPLGHGFRCDNDDCDMFGKKIDIIPTESIIEIHAQAIPQKRKSWSGKLTPKEKANCPYCGGEKSQTPGEMTLKTALEMRLKALQLEAESLNNEIKAKYGKEMGEEDIEKMASEPTRLGKQSPQSQMYYCRSMIKFIKDRLDKLTQEEANSLVACENCSGQQFIKVDEYKDPAKRGIPKGKKFPDNPAEGEMFYLESGGESEGTTDKVYRYSSKVKTWIQEKTKTPWQMFVDWFTNALNTAVLRLDDNRISMKIERMPLTRLGDDQKPMKDTAGQDIKYGGKNPYGDPHPLLNIKAIWNTPTRFGSIANDYTTMMKFRVTQPTQKGNILLPNPLGGDNRKAQKNLYTIL